MNHAMTFPDINPVIFSFGPFGVSYYSLAYVIGVVLGIFYASKLAQKFNISISKKQWEDFLTYAVLGVVVGGRMGYVLMYDPIKYFSHPLTILKTYEGGMSFHGGILGLVIACYIFAKKSKIEFVSLIDLLSITAPIGLFLGRIANFINGELYGRITDVPWAFVFPNSDGFPRHPSQLYEAFLEGLCLLIIMFLNRGNLKYKGYNSGLFLILYGSFRVIIECFREPDMHIGFIFKDLTMGQILSVPMILIGFYLIIASKNKNVSRKINS